MKKAGTGANFRGLLKEAGWTQSELAKHILMHPNSVSKWANGAPVPGAVLALLALRIKVRALIDD